MSIIRKMRGGPIQKDADAGLVEFVDKVHEVLRCAVTARRRKITYSLISPRAIERMLHDGHQLDVRVAHLLHIRNQPVGKFNVRKPARAFLDDSPPRT